MRGHRSRISLWCTFVLPAESDHIFFYLCDHKRGFPMRQSPHLPKVHRPFPNLLKNLFSHSIHSNHSDRDKCQSDQRLSRSRRPRLSGKAVLVSSELPASSNNPGKNQKIYFRSEFIKPTGGIYAIVLTFIYPDLTEKEVKSVSSVRSERRVSKETKVRYFRYVLSPG